MQQLRNILTEYITRKFANLQDIENEAEDIVNQTFLKVWQAGKRDLSFGYLSLIATNTAIDRFRQLRGKISLNDTLELAAEDSAEFLQIEKTPISPEIINSAICTLKKEEEAVIRLRYYDDYSFAEIVTELNLKLNTVLSHHQRGIVKLRNHFTTLCPDYDYQIVEESELDSKTPRHFGLL